MLRGLRPLPGKSQDHFSEKVIQGMKEKIEAILDKNQVLDEKDSWLVSYILRVSEFRLADWKERDRILVRINRNKKKGHKLGFTEKEIKGLNKAILQKEKEGKLEIFIEKIKKKKEKAKK